MSWAASALAVGVGSSILGNQAAKKAAAKQAALAQKEAARIREASAKARVAMERELESIRTLRDLDLPAFRQAQQQAHLSASRAAERTARSRTMGRMGGDVRQALFGGQFDQYIGSRMEGFQRHAELTQQLFQGTSAIQKMTMDSENAAAQLGYAGSSQAIQMDAAAGDSTANILGVTAQVLSAKAASDADAAANKKKSKQDFIKDSIFNEVDPTAATDNAGKFGNLYDLYFGGN